MSPTSPTRHHSHPNKNTYLAWKLNIDPAYIVTAAGVAGVQQARNEFSGYGQGAQGYAKRFGATFADFTMSNFLGNAVLPSVFKQDPRYFYKGTGTVKSRVLYALANAVICKGDNGHWQANYSSILGSLAAGGISNLYYPASDRGAGLTFENTAIGIGATAILNLMKEFVLTKITTNVPRRPNPTNPNPTVNLWLVPRPERITTLADSPIAKNPNEESDNLAGNKKSRKPAFMLLRVLADFYFIFGSARFCSVGPALHLNNEFSQVLAVVAQCKDRRTRQIRAPGCGVELRKVKHEVGRPVFDGVAAESLLRHPRSKSRRNQWRGVLFWRRRRSTAAVDLGIGACKDQFGPFEVA